MAENIPLSQLTTGTPTRASKVISSDMGADRLIVSDILGLTRASDITDFATAVEAVSPPVSVETISDALGYTPYSADNPQGYINAAGAANVTAGGDLSGTLGNATVAKVAGHTVVVSAPQNGDRLIYSNGQWVNYTETAIDGGNF